MTVRRLVVLSSLALAALSPGAVSAEIQEVRVFTTGYL